MTADSPTALSSHWRIHPPERIAHEVATRRPLITDAALALPLTSSGASARGTIRAVSVFDRRPVFNLGTRHEVTVCFGMRRSHAALGGAVLCTTRSRQWAGGCRGGRRDRWDCRRWPRRPTGAIVGGSVGGVTGAFSPRPSYAYPYGGYVAHGGCRWIPAHYDRWGEWRRGHCTRY